MHDTRNDLPLGTRKKIVELCNARLADAVDLYLQAKSAHWNVKGPQFRELHELFDALADEAREAADDLAERAVQLGGRADGSVARVAKATTLKALPGGLSEGLACCAALADATASVAKHLRAGIDKTARLGDAATADLFTELVRVLDKRLWMIEAHLER